MRLNTLDSKDVIARNDIAVSGNALPGSRYAGVTQLEEVEKDHVLSVLRQAGGNRTKASRMLGVDRKTLYLKLKKYRITDQSLNS